MKSFKEFLAEAGGTGSAKVKEYKDANGKKVKVGDRVTYGRDETPAKVKEIHRWAHNEIEVVITTLSNGKDVTVGGEDTSLDK